MAANDETSFDPRRRLCPDGACVGVIGSDGKCSVCGASDPNAGAPAPSDSIDSPGSGFSDATDSTEEAERDSPLDEASSASGFDTTRRLCPDGACIGVIGENNRCSVCGRAAEG